MCAKKLGQSERVALSECSNEVTVSSSLTRFESGVKISVGQSERVALLECSNEVTVSSSLTRFESGLKISVGQSKENIKPSKEQQDPTSCYQLYAVNFFLL
ncbi:hypothetical protein L1887_30511 [Cichorium endivia]|nr:hypothetical protein L1887_30511 [Cichorium endivia]